MEKHHTTTVPSTVLRKQTSSQRLASDSVGNRVGIMVKLSAAWGVFLGVGCAGNWKGAYGRIAPLPVRWAAGRFVDRGMACIPPIAINYSWLATLLNVALALVPIEVIAPKHTTTINASMTAYSTAVGPSSDAKKRCTLETKFFIASLQMRDHPIRSGMTGNEHVTALRFATAERGSHTVHPRGRSRRDTCRNQVCIENLGQNRGESNFAGRSACENEGESAAPPGLVPFHPEHPA